MLVGYSRVSTDDQSLDRQIDQLIDAGVDMRMIYQEKVSGTIRKGPELERLLSELHRGDVIVITDLTKLSRSTKDLLEIVDEIKSIGADLKSLKDTWLDTTASNPYSRFLLMDMAGLSQLERDLTSTRVKEGLAAAYKQGRKGGRPSKQIEKRDTVLALANAGFRIPDIMKEAGLSRSTVNRIHDKQKGLFMN